MSKLIIALILISVNISSLESQSVNYWDILRANSNSALWSGAFPVISEMKNGNFIICWKRDHDRISGRLFTPDLKAFSNELLLVDQSNKTNKTNLSKGNPEQPVLSVRDHELAVLSLQSWDFIFFWQNDDGLIKGRKFNMNGVYQGIEINIIPPEDFEAWHPSPTLLQNGNFVLSWHLGPEFGSTNPDKNEGIYCQIFDSDGNTVSDTIKVNDTDTNNEWNPAITTLTNGNFVIVWQGGSSNDIHGQVFDESGEKVSDELLINSETNGSQIVPSVGALSNGDFVVTWQEGDDKISAEIFSANGIRREFLFSNEDINYDANPVAIGLKNGGFLLAWIGDWGPIRGQLFNAKYEISGGLFKIGNNSMFSDFIKGSSAGNNGYVTCWQDNNKGIVFRYLLNEPLILDLSKFDLLDPKYDETLYTNEVTLKWNSSTKVRRCYPFEVRYDLFLSTQDNFSETPSYGNRTDTVQVLDRLTGGTSYLWKVRAKNLAGDTVQCNSIFGFYIDPSSIDKQTDFIVRRFELEQNYPNPFNPETAIGYRLSVAGHVNLSIYNIHGQKVETLVNERQSPGEHGVKWNASGMASGIYYYVIRAGEFSASKKMVLIR